MKQLMLFFIVLLLFIQNGGCRRPQEVSEPTPDENQEQTEPTEETNKSPAEPTEVSEATEEKVSQEASGAPTVPITESIPPDPMPTRSTVTEPLTEPTSPIIELPTQPSPIIESTELESMEAKPSKDDSNESNSLEIEISIYIDYAIACGENYGLIYDPSVIECWDNPLIIGSDDSKSRRDIRSAFAWYQAQGYSIFSVWEELRTDGRYDLYIAYA